MDTSWGMFLAGAILGFASAIVVLGLCAASGRSDLEMTIMELENLLGDMKAELIRRRSRMAREDDHGTTT